MSGQVKEVTKTENITMDVNDEADLDCFGNYSRKEILTCAICGVREECSVVTGRIKENLKVNYRPILKNQLKETQTKLKSDQKVKPLMVRLQQIQEKEETMSDEKKMKKKVKSTETESTGKVLKKKVKSSDSKIEKKVASSNSDEKSEKKGAGRKSKREAYEKIKGTIVPVGFSSLVEGLSKIGTLNHKTSITTVASDAGLFCSIPGGHAKSDEVQLWLNKSKGAKLTGTNNVTVDNWPSGEVRVIIKNSEKSIKDGLSVVKAWKEAFKTQAPVKKAKKEDSEEKSEKKVKKVSKEENGHSNGKSNGHSEKSEKKSVPLVKAKKDKPKSPPVMQVEDEEA